MTAPAAAAWPVMCDTRQAGQVRAADMPQHEQGGGDQHDRIGEIDIELAAGGRHMDLEEHGGRGRKRQQPVEGGGVVRRF